MADKKIAPFKVTFVKDPAEFNGKMKQSIKIQGSRGEQWVGMQQSPAGWVLRNEIGKTIDLEWWEYNGKIYAKRADQPQGGIPSQSQMGGGKSPDVQKQINRGCAFKGACDLFAHSTELVTIDTVLIEAQKAFNWIETGDTAGAEPTDDGGDDGSQPQGDLPNF